MSNQAQPTEVIKHLFKCSIMNCRFIFKDGKTAVFYNGEYLTDNSVEIAELKEEAASRDNPYIFIDAERETVNVNQEDPVEAIRRKAVEDYLAGQAAALNQAPSESDKEFKMASIANSNTVGAAMSGSTSVDAAGGTATISGAPVGTASVMQAKLAALKAQG